MTLPYVTGTVSVTAGSAVVTGSGSGWKTALIAGGLFGLDSNNGNPVPIDSVDSDTQITLAKPWRGSTASGQGYWIIRDTDAGRQTVANASGLAQIIADLRAASTAAIAGLTPSADKLAYFNGVSTAALTDIRAKGRDILAAADAAAAYSALGEVPNGSLPPRLKGTVGSVSDPNDITESGYYGISGGAPNAPEASASMVVEHIQYSTAQARQFAYRHSNNNAYTRVRSGGVWQPWDRLFDEYGSNGNGEYWRFANGFLVCKTTATLNADTVFDTSFYVQADGGASWTFPASFVGAQPDVSLNKVGGAGALWGYASSVSTTSCLLAPIASRSRTGQLFAATAKGRWF